MKKSAELYEWYNLVENQLETAHGTRMSSMFQMKEDVENEFSDRMEQLRDMYKTGLATNSIFSDCFLYH